MSSRDIGPALPPHLRRNHRNTGADSGDSYEERNRDTEDERRRKHRDKYSDRQCDKDRGRARREEYRDWDRSSRHSSDRDRHKARREEEERVNYRKERNKKEKRNKLELSSSSKSSKRSKTDRTYNTDTEESSDDDGDNPQKWSKAKCSDTSDSEQENEERNSSKQPKVSSSNSNGQETDNVCAPAKVTDYSVIGPALPPHLLSKETSSRLELKDNWSYLDASSSNIDGSTLGLKTKSELDKDNFSDCVGPALPPHLNLKRQTEAKDGSVEPTLGSHLVSKIQDETEDESLVSSIGPALPPHLQIKMQVEEQEDNVVNTIGAVLPPHLTQAEVDSQQDENYVNPVLPPHLLKRKSSLIGPSPPPHLVRKQDPGNETTVIGPVIPSSLKRSSAVGPSLPLEGEFHSKSSDESSDDEIVGPLLPEDTVKSGKNYVVQAQLERNAAAIKRQLEEKDLPDCGVPRREDWMLSLPPEGTVDLGLGPRTFRARGAPEKGADRSAWTDTPADKARKEEEAKCRFELGISSTDEVKKVAKTREMSNRDKAMEAVTKKHKRSKESLLESHQNKLQDEKKKKKDAGTKQERRPFSREHDLKTNVFDDAQKKAIYKKAQILDTRFSSGESKFL